MSAPRDRDAARDDAATSKASPEPGDNPGYAEDAPHDRRAAHQPHAEEDPPSPDEGGLARDPDAEDGTR